MPRAKGKRLSAMLKDPTVVYGDKFGDIGGSAGDRIKRSKITEDDPRWNPKTMGNKRGRIRR